MITTTRDGDTFTVECDLIEVTSAHRPDTSWKVFDAAGHEHAWYVGDDLAQSYDPAKSYHTPTLLWVKTGEEYWDDDDEPHDIGELRCKLCGQVVQRGYMADDVEQYIPGLRRYLINGKPVTKEEFKQRALDAGIAWMR